MPYSTLPPLTSTQREHDRTPLAADLRCAKPSAQRRRSSQVTRIRHSAPLAPPICRSFKDRLQEGAQEIWKVRVRPRPAHSFFRAAASAPRGICE